MGISKILVIAFFENFIDEKSEQFTYPVFKKWILKNARMEALTPHNASIIALFLMFQELKSELEFLKIAKIHFSDPLLETNLRPKLRF